MAINQFHPTPSPLEGIANALRIVESVYGIKGAAQKADLLEAQYKQMQQANDPNSNYSKTRQAAAGAAVNSASQMGMIKPEDKSALLSTIQQSTGADLDKLGETHPLFQMTIAKMNADAQRSKTQALVEPKQQAQALAVAKSIEDHPIVQQSNSIDSQAQKDLNTLSNRKTIDPQTFNELQKGMANMISGGSSSAIGTENRQTFESLQTKLTELKQRIENKKIDINSPEVVDNLREGFNQLQLAARQNRLDFAKQAAVGLNPMGLDYIQNTINDKVSNYARSVVSHPYYQKNTIGGASSNQAGSGKGGGGSGIPGVSSAYGSQTGPHGNTVYQNGHMYQWNPDKKKYE